MHMILDLSPSNTESQFSAGTDLPRQTNNMKTLEPLAKKEKPE